MGFKMQLSIVNGLRSLFLLSQNSSTRVSSMTAEHYRIHGQKLLVFHCAYVLECVNTPPLVRKDAVLLDPPPPSCIHTN